MTETPRRPWQEPGYSDIVAARRGHGDVEVEFANGDVVLAPAAALGIPSDDFRLEVDPHEALSIRAVTASGAAVEISWTHLRATTDPEFAQEMRRRDAEEARRLGLRLKALREDRNLSQRDLAGLAGMSPPQLSKIESGTFDLRVSTVQTLLRTMGASLADIAGPDVPEISQRELRKRVRQAGVPADVVDRLLAIAPRGAAVTALARAFAWTRDALLAGVPVARAVAAPVRFKAIRSQEASESPLVTLAYTLSEIVRAHANRAPYNTIPNDPIGIRREARDRNGQVTLESLLRWMWAAGIAVIPLHGGGGFSAAVWMVDDVPVVVLKEAREVAAFWLFDLAHELGHIARGHVAATGLVDVDSPRPSAQDHDEQEASDFALELLLPDHAALLRAVRDDARGNYLRFKGAVATVARRADLNPGILGMVAAYELTEVGQYKDRWGSANNLAKPDGVGRSLVQQALREHLPPDRLSDVEALLIAAFMTEPEDEVS